MPPRIQRPSERQALAGRQSLSGAELPRVMVRMRGQGISLVDDTYSRRPAAKSRLFAGG